MEEDFYAWEGRDWASLRTTNPIERVNKEFKRRTKAMEITGGEATTHRLLARGQEEVPVDPWLA